MTEDTTLLVGLVILVSGAILVMGILSMALHCRRIRHKDCRDKEQELWADPQETNKVSVTSQLNFPCLFYAMIQLIWPDFLKSLLGIENRQGPPGFVTYDLL